jgi:inorganic phosphate transporter, PiT family
MDLQLVIVIILALGFDLLNGVHDSSNIVATMISSRAIPPRVALAMTAVAEFTGPFIFGVAVAKTIGDEIVKPGYMNIDMIMAALISAVLWNLITWWLGIPSSSSHALIGGLTGAVVCAVGWNALKLSGLEKVLIVLFTSPLIGFSVGWLITKLVFFLSRGATPGVNIVFKRFQILTAISLALSHGTNDAQKTMGIITLALVTTGVLQTFQVPTWVMISCSAMIALGTSLGGWRLIRTLGAKFYKIKPVDGFCSQLSSAGVILAASLVGGPVSTTQVVSTAIMGVGAAERVNKVRWGVAGEIVTAWFLTIPATGLVAAGVYWLITTLIR